MGCENCSNWKYAYQRLEDRVSELRNELDKERRKNETFESVKRERDELKRNADRSYDRWVSDPRRCEGE